MASGKSSPEALQVRSPLAVDGHPGQNSKSRPKRPNSSISLEPCEGNVRFVGSTINEWDWLLPLQRRGMSYKLMIMTAFHPAFIQGIGGPELLIILVIILLLFGSKKLPELARGLGKSMKEFKKATQDVQHDFQEAMDAADPQKPLDNAPNKSENSPPPKGTQTPD